jgi:hypothetical protein
MVYIRTDDIKKKQSNSMKKRHMDCTYNWQEIVEKRKSTQAENGTKPGRKPGSGREKTGDMFPCPTCQTPVYHQKSVIQSGKRKHCSRECLSKNPDYIQKLKQADKSYTQTEQYKNIFRKTSTPAYKKYRNIVDKLTEKEYVKHYNQINPSGYPRTIHGTDGGYQLDHIKPVRQCFDEGIDPSLVANVENLRMLPWKENLMRNWCDDII